MKKTLLIVLSLLGVCSVQAQIVKETHDVGPYKIDVFEDWDIRYTLVKDPKIFYQIKPDTVVRVQEKIVTTYKAVHHAPINKAYEATLFYTVPRFSYKNGINTYGVSAVRKFGVCKKYHLMLNAGLELSFSHARTKTPGNLDSPLFGVGVPVSIQYVNLKEKEASLFASIGITPAFYTAKVFKSSLEETESLKGIYVEPKFEVGAYVPVGNYHAKVGVNVSYKAEGGDDKMFKDRLGCVFVGGNIGLVF